MENLLLFLLFPAAQVTPHASSSVSIESSTISGVVHDPRGRPVAGATVLLYPPADLPFQDPEILHTDTEGRFRSARETPGEGSVIVIAAGFSPYWNNATTAAKPIDVELTDGAELAGRVFDARSKAPISGAKLQAEVFPPARSRPSRDPLLGVVEATTDDRGRFRLEGVPHGSWSLSASAPGYRRETVTVGDVGQAGEIFLFPGAGIDGVVFGPKGEAVEGALVHVSKGSPWSWQAWALPETTDESGRFRILGAGPGLYRLTARHPDYAFSTYPEVEVEEEDVSVTLTLPRPTTVSGRAVDEEGTPLTGHVFLESVSGSEPPEGCRDLLAAEMDGRGRFTLSQLPPGEHRLGVQASGFPSKPIDFTTDSRDRERDLGTIVFEEGLSIRGLVLDGNEDPLAGAKIWAFPGERGEFAVPILENSPRIAIASTGADGAFVLRGLEPGPHQISTFAPGFVSVEKWTVEAGEDEVVLELSRSGSLRGKVVDEEGRPIVDFRTEVVRDLTGSFYPGRQRQRGMHEEMVEGTFRIEDLAPSTYDLYVVAEDRMAARVARIEVPSGDVADVGTIVLRSGGTIRGKVRDGDGVPVPGGRVAAHPGPQGLLTDASGEFEIRGLEDGVIDIRVTHPDYAGAVLKDVELRAELGPVEVEIELSQGGRLEGLVRDRRGVGVAGRQLEIQSPGINETVASGSDGAFVFERLPAGIHRVHLQSGDRFSSSLQEREVEVAEGETAFLAFDSREILVTGQVSRRGLPRPGAHVLFRLADSRGGYHFVGRDPRSGGPFYLNAIARGDGYYELLVDTPGEYRVVVTEADGSRQYPEKTVVVPDAESQGVDLDFGTVSVRGRVVRERSDEPIDKARIEASSGGPGANTTMADAVTDESGRFLVELDPGRYRIRAHARGFAPRERALTVEEGIPEIAIALSVGGSIRGRVLDRNGNDPGRYYVHAVDAGFPTTEPPSFSDWASVDPDGTFAIEDLAEARYNLLAGSDLLGFAFAPAVLPGESLTLQLRPAAFVDLTVRLPDGEPAPGARVALSAVAGQRARGVFGTTDAEGRTELFLPTGPIELKAAKGEGLEGAIRLHTAEGARVAAEIVLNPTN